MMEKTKKPEKFFFWLDQYKAARAISKAQDLSISDLVKEAVDSFKYPVENPKKARFLKIDEKTSLKIQTVADDLFKTSGWKEGNKSDALYYILEEYLKNKK
jgi:hypothetical protein